MWCHMRQKETLTLSAASLTEKHEDSKASSRTSISGCSASAHPFCPPALAHRAVRQPDASTYNTHTHTHSITTLLKHCVCLSADLDASIYLKARGGRSDHFGQEQQHTDSGQQLWAVLDKQKKILIINYRGFSYTDVDRIIINVHLWHYEILL